MRGVGSDVHMPHSDPHIHFTSNYWVRYRTLKRCQRSVVMMMRLGLLLLLKSSQLRIPMHARLLAAIGAAMRPHGGCPTTTTMTTTMRIGRLSRHSLQMHRALVMRMTWMQIHGRSQASAAVAVAPPVATRCLDGWCPDTRSLGRRLLGPFRRQQRSRSLRISNHCMSSRGSG